MRRISITYNSVVGGAGIPDIAKTRFNALRISTQWNERRFRIQNHLQLFTEQRDMETIRLKSSILHYMNDVFSIVITYGTEWLYHLASRINQILDL